MIPNATIFVTTSVLLGLVAVAFLVGTLRLPPQARRYGYATVLACGAISVKYALMSAEVWTISTTGTDESIVRFVGYTVAWGAISYVLGSVADAGRLKTAGVFVCSLTTLWGTFASWVLSGTAETAVSLIVLLALIGLVYLLFGALSRTVVTTSDHRELLYTKLKFLVLLAWAGLLVLGVVSAQNLGLLGGFVGLVTGSYVDLILFVGFGGLVLRNATALEETAASTVLVSFLDDPEADGTATGVEQDVDAST